MTTAFGHLLRLQPGRRDSIVRSPRPDLPALLAVGQSAEWLADRMAALHALCAHGHRLAATLALRAARGEPAACSAAERASLRHAVAREQLLRIAHDWPRLLPDAPSVAPPLHGCPLWDGALAPAAQLRALPAWLQRHWLRRPVALLLAALADDAAAQALAWARATPTALAALFAAVLPRALALQTPRTGCAMPDTGPWNRRRFAFPAAADNAGMRLIARLQDLLRLAAPDGEDVLSIEAAPHGPGGGRATVEVGRGALRYRVRLGADGTVCALRLRSPTDCNFHHAGVLAEALRAVETADDARTLAVAFDPCEPFEVAVHAENPACTS